MIEGNVTKNKTIQCTSDFNAPLTRHCSLGQKNEMRTFHMKHLKLLFYERCGMTKELIFFCCILSSAQRLCAYNPRFVLLFLVLYWH